jgi:hypothetical protein
MKIKEVVLALVLILSFSNFLKAEGFYSYSFGQFDVNDSFDSLEGRIEYLSNKWNLTPSFATGYYDQGSSKDLGNNLEFRSQLELSYNLEKNKRVGISLNHISNASLADENPGTESIVISFINPF